jgi:6-pyruvoyltetrahydropterin/6-carboxytetrahydropterin synthase
MPTDRSSFKISDFEQTVDTEFIKRVDHKNLNLDVDAFKKNNPTVENITTFAWEKLVGKFGKQILHCVKVWESDRTYCSYYG